MQNRDFYIVYEKESLNNNKHQGEYPSGYRVAKEIPNEIPVGWIMRKVSISRALFPCSFIIASEDIKNIRDIYYRLRTHAHMDDIKKVVNIVKGIYGNNEDMLLHILMDIFGGEVEFFEDGFIRY